ncbi:MAG: DUF4912 domain-containing protein [Fibrobacter sp.]|nr:DUF4912 domain-containing protein [Fibrobacter sp.]
MATKKKVEDIEKPVAEKKPVAKKVAKKTAEKVVSEEKPAAKKVVAKVAKKPTATVEKVAAKAAPVKKTAKAKAVDKAEAPAKTAKATKTTSKVSEKTAKSVAAAKKVVKAATKAKKVDVEVVETPAVKKAAKATPEALPQSFDPEYLVLMQKDPNWMQAFWEVSEERVKAAKKGKGKLVLRLFDIANDLTVKRNKKLKFHDIVVPEDARNWYIEKKSTQNCAAALGVVSGNKFEALVEAGPMQTFTLEGSEVNPENVFVRASLGGATLGGFGSSGLSSMSAKNWLENAVNGLSSSSGSMFSGALSSAALKSNKLELPKDSVNYGKDFFLWVKTRLIVYGGTRPDAHLQVRGEPFPLNPDGTFSFEEDLPDVTKIIPVFATDKDGDFPTTIVPIVVKRTE